MELNLPKEWFANRAKREGNTDVCAGNPPTSQQQPESIAPIVAHLVFGKFVSLQRRKLHLSLEELAARSESAADELRAIEDDPFHEPEPSTVFGLANAFDLPPQQLLRAANLVESKSTRLPEEALRFAASAKPVGPLTPEEQLALEAYVAALLEAGCK